MDKYRYATPLVLTGNTFDAIPFNEVIVLEDDTTIDTLEVTDQNGNKVDCLESHKITDITPLKKGTVLHVPFQFPYTKIYVTAGSVQLNCTKFLPIPE